MEHLTLVCDVSDRLLNSGLIATIWAGELVGLREIVGILVITTAGLAEVVVVPLGRQRFRRHSR
ncbi:MAG: hypothetical protein ACYTBS_15810 [Planctomycetota bacterium]|jgi:hypothetical protein